MRLLNPKKYLITILFALLAQLSMAQTIFYVKPAASGSGNGSSWANASGDLSTPILAAPDNSQIWIASRTYNFQIL